jgi:hypothetical protein
MNEELEVSNTEATAVNTESKTTPSVNETDLKNEELHKAIVAEETEEQFNAAALEEKSLEELAAETKALLMLTPKTASERMKIIRKVFYDKYNPAKEDAKEKYNAEKAEDAPDFEFEKTPLIDELKAVEEEIKKARAEEKKRIDEEKKKNLAAKEALITKLEAIVAEDETLETIAAVKEIQREWKSIRVLPKESVNDLWDRYNTLLNRFYDNHGINIELKELDRQKNLEAKIELTKKVEAIKDEKSIKRSFILLNKYHEEFKNIGPVPQESREPIWQAFKSASDAVYEQKRKIYDELETAKEGNLQKKIILSEKADLLNAVKPKDVKGWNEKTKAFEELFAEWKKIGPVPKSNKDAVWIQFNGVLNDFYTERKAFFKNLNSARNENLKLKEALCEKAEALKDSKDWAATGKAIIALQADWKKVGPVPEKVNQAIWKRFRSACDFFFEAKNEAFSGKREEEKANLEKKEALIKQLQELTSQNADHKQAFTDLKKINAEWRNAGFVPYKDAKRISKAYDDANNAVYTKYSGQIEAAKEANLSEYYQQLKTSSPNGVSQLEKEERNIKRRITTLNEEIASIERNMSFFNKSKTADKMLKDFNVKIERVNKQISKLKKELSVIKNAKKSDPLEEDNGTDEVPSN